jgi:predicted ABC-type ATPase
MRKLSDKDANNKQPRMIVVGGVNGAGKSTLIKSSAKQHSISNVINPDEKLKEYKKAHPNDGELKAWRSIVEEIDSNLSAKKDMVLESTLTGKKVINRMKTAQEKGYRVELNYVVLDNVDRHIERVASRVKKGGHHIPEEDIRRRYDRSIGNLKEASKYADNIKIFDNTEQRTAICEIENDKITYKSDDIKNKDIANFLHSFEDATQAEDDYSYASVANYDSGR